MMRGFDNLRISSVSITIRKSLRALRAFWIRGVFSVLLACLFSPAGLAQDNWFPNISPEEVNGRKYVSLVFASQDFRSPISIFGHTFLVFHNQSTPELDAPVLEFLGNTEGPENFALKAIYASLPGRFHWKRFLYKHREYDHENRDLWVYTLRLSQAERKELSQIALLQSHERYPYRFLSTNCSYYIFKLLSNLDREFESETFVYTLPIETIKSLDRARRIENVVYIASRRSLLARALASLNKEDLDTLRFVLYGYDLSSSTQQENLHLSNAIARAAAFQIDREQDLERRRHFFRILRSHQLLSTPESPPLSPHIIEKNIQIRAAKSLSSEMLYTSILPFSQNIFSPRLDGDIGSNLEIARVDIISDGEKIAIEKVGLIHFLALTPSQLVFSSFASLLEVGIEPSLRSDALLSEIYLRFGRGLALGIPKKIIFGVIPSLGLILRRDHEVSIEVEGALSIYLIGQILRGYRYELRGRNLLRESGFRELQSVFNLVAEGSGEVSYFLSLENQSRSRITENLQTAVSLGIAFSF